MLDWVTPQMAPRLKPDALVQIIGLSKRYEQSRWSIRRRPAVKCLNAVSLAITEGSTFGLLGESGAGKSTLARCLALLEKPTDGEIWFEGRNILTLPRHHTSRVRRRIQLIFQDPATALNPRLRAAELVAEPLVIQSCGTRREQRQTALQMMEEVGLSASWGSRLPLEFSGGQRQRLALARALALKPKLVILDETFSGIDLPLRAQILNLLSDLKQRWNLTYVLISHDLSLLCGIADEIAVLYEGQVVEQGSAGRVLSAPEHAHTRALVSASLIFRQQMRAAKAGCA